MRRIYLVIGLVIGASLALFSIAQATTVLYPYQGGTGINTTTVASLGFCLTVSSTNPLVYKFATCGAGGGGAGGGVNTSTANYFAYYLTNTSVSGTPFVQFANNSLVFSTNTLFTTINASSTTSTNLYVSSLANLVGLTFGTASGTSVTTTNLNVSSLANINQLGVNSSSPIAQLALQGVALTDPFTILSSTASQMFKVKTDGQVIIGPNSLSQTGQLTIETPTTNDIALSFTNGTHYTFQLGRVAGTSGQAFIGGPGGTALNLRANGVDRLFIINKGFVGINSATPFSSFVVQGVATNSPIFDVVSSSLVTALRVAANGNVGVNSGTPIDTLAVQGGLQVVGGNTSTNLYVSSLANINQLGINSSSPIATLALQGVSRTEILDIASSTGTSLMHISQTGNVGIGTVTPSALLHLSKSSLAANDYEILRLSYPNALNSTIHLSAFAGDNITETQRITMGLGAATTNGYMSFSTYNNGLNEAMRILGNGSVGINSTSPVAQLAVQGTAGQDPFDISSSTGASVLHILKTGMTGLGTTAPRDLLEISNPAVSGVAAIQFSAGNNAVVSNFSSGRIASGHTSGAFSGGFIDLQYPTGSNSFVTAFRLKNGLIGIGTTTPQSKLTVQAAGTENPFSILSSTPASGSMLALLTNGNLGLNSSSPIDTLAVQGGLQVVGGATTTNLYISALSNFAGLLTFSTATGTSVTTTNLGILGCLVDSAGSCGTANYVLVANGTSTRWTPTSSLNIGGGGGSGSGTVNSGNAGQVTYYPTSAAAVNGTNTLFITPASLVGLNTTTPDALLTLQARKTEDPFSIVSSTPTSTSMLRLLANGNLGINSSTGRALLSIQGNTTSKLFEIASNTAALPLLQLIPTGGYGFNAKADGTDGISYEFNRINSNGGTIVDWEVGGSSSVGSIDYQGNQTINTVSAGRGVTLGASADQFWATPILNITAGSAVIQPVIKALVGTAQLLRVNADGKFLSGTNTPDASVYFTIHPPFATTTDMFQIVSSTGSRTTSTTIQFIVKNSGFVGIGSSTPTYNFVSTGTAAFANLPSNASTDNLVCVQADGQLQQEATSCTVSSARFKENIQSLSPQTLMEEARKLRAVSFDYRQAEIPTRADERMKSAVNGGGQGSTGFIAEEVAVIDPMLVVFTSDYKPEDLEFEQKNYPDSIIYKTPNGIPLIPQTVDYARMSVILSGAIQDLDQRVTALELGKVPTLGATVKLTWFQKLIHYLF